MNRDFNEYIEILNRRKWVLAVPVVLGTLIAAIISLRMTPLYRSSTLILVEEQQVPERYVTPTDRTPFAQRLSTIKQQILSRTNLEKIIDNFGLHNDELGSSPGPVAALMNRLGVRRATLTGRQEAVERMRENIEVKVIGGNSVRGNDAFSISFVGKDPRLTMEVTNTLASLFIEENLKIREQYVEGTSDFIVNELDKAKVELETQEVALRIFKEKHMGSLPAQLEANLRALDRFQIEIQTVTNSLKNAEDRRIMLEGQLSSGAGADGIGLRTNPVAIELAVLRKDLASLRSQYKDDYPDVKIIKSRIGEIESLIESSKNSAGKANTPSQILSAEGYEAFAEIEAEVKTLKKRETDLRSQIKIYERRVEDTPRNEQKLSELMRDYNISQRNYQTLLENKLNARLAENLEKRQKGERFRVIDPANLPEKPFKPDKSKITFLGSLAGLCAGGGIVFFIEFLMLVYRKPEELGEAFDFPVLGAIPEFTLKRK